MIFFIFGVSLMRNRFSTVSNQDFARKRKFDQKFYLLSRKHVRARGKSILLYWDEYPMEIAFFRRGYSSVVEHSTADREVPGSNPGVP